MRGEEKEGEMDAQLCVKTCDKCGKTMCKDDEVFVVSEGNIQGSNELLDMVYSQIYYVCHKDCWDGNVYMGWE